MTSVLRRKRLTTVPRQPTPVLTAASLAALFLAVQAAPAQVLPPPAKADKVLPPPAKADDRVLPPPTLEQDRPRNLDQPREGLPAGEQPGDGLKQYQIELDLPSMERVFQLESERVWQERIRREARARNKD